MKNNTVLPEERSMEDLINRLTEAEETIEAIKYNKVDALLISTEDGEQVYRLKDNENIYQAFIEKINEGAATLTNSGTIIFTNDKFSELLRIPADMLTGSSIFKWIAISDLNGFTSYFHNSIEDTNLEINLLRTDGLQVPVSLYLSKLRLYDETEPVLCIVATDLTEKKRNQEIFEAEKLARTVIEQTPEAIIVCDEKFKIIRASRGAEKLADTELLNEFFDSIFYLEDTDRKHLTIRDVIANPLPCQTDVLFKRGDEEYFNLVFNVGALSGPEDKTQGYIVTLTNITKHVKAEEIISASLKEKTTLLKEIHHRVKNNLQIVSSLLNIQASYIKDPAMYAIFQECQQRISSMALIHKKLYQSKSFSEINIIDYLKDMTGFLCSTYMFDSRQVKFDFALKYVPFSIESAVPVGLILNELITNCFKHANLDRETGELKISVLKDADDSICISVKDNGVGFPENLDLNRTETLGLQLVNSLTQQLKGSVELIGGSGTEFRITIPLIEIAD